MTTAHGNPIGDNQNSLTAGPRGPLLMQDYQLLEKMATFNRERVPERIVVRQLVHFYKADPDYGCGVAAKLKPNMGNFAAWAKLPLKDLVEKTSEENYGY